MRHWRDWDDRFPPPSRPREAKGGIKAQTRQGAFGRSWWARRWIAVLESFQLGGRLTRGRAYARKGQVLSVEVQPGAVSASVQGSRPKPYEVSIAVKTLSGAEWRRIAEVVASQAIFAAKMLGGEMPEDIETVFEQVGTSLFPSRHSDLTTQCSCPDWSNPCKHIAAVYYLLGEEFDRDPFLIFRLRGLGREGFMSLLGTPAADDRSEPAVEPEPLPVEHQPFWTGKALPEDLLDEEPSSPAGAALPRRLGAFPFWRGGDGFLATLDDVYAAARSRALEVLGSGARE